jgi:hypothetical protein
LSLGDIIRQIFEKALVFHFKRYQKEFRLDNLERENILMKNCNYFYNMMHMIKYWVEMESDERLRFAQKLREAEQEILEQEYDQKKHLESI